MCNILITFPCLTLRHGIKEANVISFPHSRHGRARDYRIS